MIRQRLRAALVPLCLSILLMSQAIAGTAAKSAEGTSAYIDPALVTALKERGGEASMFVYVRGRPDLSPAFGMKWEDRGRFVYKQLSEFAAHSQAPILRELDGMGIQGRSFWIENVISIKQGTLPMVQMLAGRDDVLAIVAEPVGYIPEPEPQQPQGGNAPNAPVSSLVQIKAPAVWDQGITGQGITVGIIDSGTRYTHQALVNQYRGNVGGGSFNHNYNWFDIGGSTAPTWPNPHGTHVTGTAIGDDGNGNQIGVAPGAQWISCLGCTSTGCPGTNLLMCAQFMTAPTDLTGSSPDPDLRPHVVNNSWGDCDQSYDNWYQGVVDAWIAAGIVPVFANGNASNCGYSSPPGLNTVGNPARYGSVLGIGSSSNNTGQYAPHSNWGPTDNPNNGTDPNLPDPRGYFDLKPNVVVPGVAIRSSVSSSDTAYESSGWNGTSMSAPGATGVIALMLSAAPSLIGDYATIGTLLMETANPIPYASGGPNPGPGNVPNYATGWGEVDALAAVTAAIAAAGPQGTIAGVVTDDLGNPVEGARVQIENPAPPPAGWSALTDENGAYSIGLGIGTYDVVVTRYGYETATATGVEIEEDQTTTQNFQLVSAGEYVVSGTVIDSGTNWPLHARIDINGYPGDAIFTDPADGSYSITLAGGLQFDFSVTVLSGGYDGATRAVGPLTADATENFALDVDTAACSAPGYDAGALYRQTFEADNGGFSSSGTVTWTWGAPSGWPNGCGEGSSCWATGLTGNYPNNANASVTSPVIDLTGASAPLTLFWKQANHVETSQWDQAYAEYRVNGGAWQVMWQNPASTTVVDWRELTFDVSAAAGGTLELRWRLVSDGSVNFPGVYFDDILIRSGTSCTAMAGELVSGQVRDANTGQGLNGALVAIDGAGSAITSTSADPALGEGAYLLFVPEGAQDIEASFAGYQPGSLSDTFVDGQARRVDFALDAGRVTAAPSPLTSTQEFGSTENQTLTLSNDGAADAVVSLHPRSGIQQHFETDFPPAGWNVVNLGGACAWQRNDAVSRPNHAGGDGFSAAADSDACGTGSTMDTRLVSPGFSVTPTSELDFVLSYRHLGSSRLDVEISVDGGSTWTVLQTFSANTSDQGPGTPVNISLATYDGQNAQLGFRYVSPGWNWWAQVDQIVVSGTPDWLSLSPDNGTVAASGSLNVTATFDAGAASITEPGTYRATIFIQSDTPYGDIEVPVEMHVEPSANQSQLFGQVTGLGYCDDAPGPLAGATVTVTGQTGSYTLTTDAGGQYQVWLDIAESPVSVDVSATGHVSGSASGVALVGGGSVEQDFDLRLDAPCASVTPEALTASLMSGDSDTQSITLSNAGAGDLDWTTATGIPASAGGSDIRWPVAAIPSGHGVDLLSTAAALLPAAGGPLPLGGFDCDTAEGLVVLDDGTIENGYSGNPAVVSQMMFVQAYEVAVPSILSRVCLAFVSQGPSSLNHEVVVFAADGAGGAPGTELGSLAAVATSMGTSVPSTPLWNTVDLSSLNLLVQPGTVYIGVRFAPSTPNVYIASDQSAASPGATGYWWNNSAAAWAPITDAWADYKALFVRPQFVSSDGCSSPTSVPWLSVSPASGTAVAGGSSQIDATIDASGLLPGTYEATVCISGNDPQRSIIGVPVTLEVQMGPNDGTLEGTVQSLGYCSADPSALAGATIEVSGTGGTYTTTTDASGHYQLALSDTGNPWTVSVTAADHLADSESGVAVVAAGTVTVDFDLTLAAGCTTHDPAQFDVQVAVDGSTSELLTLTNAGAGPSSFTTSSIEYIQARGVHLVRPARFSEGDDERADARATDAIDLPPTVRSVDLIMGSTDVEVLLLTPDEGIGDLKAALDTLPGINTTVYAGSLASITAANLEPYDVVLINNNTRWSAAGANISVGNALADYVDAGGAVIVNNFAHDNTGWELGGRFITGGYSPFLAATADRSGTSTLGTVHLPDHPVMDGVSAVTNQFLWQVIGVDSGADRIADWHDGSVFVAANDRVVAVNVLADPGDGSGLGWTGDLDVLYSNAIQYLAGGGNQPAAWLSVTPDTGTVGAGGTSQLTVNYDATGLAPGLYTADLLVDVDEGVGDVVRLTIPVTMQVVSGDPDIFSDGFEDEPETP